MRIFISLILCYCGLIIIIASVIENRLQTSSFGTINYRIKSVLRFTLIGLIIISLGFITWPNDKEIDIPRYYIGKVLKSRTACKLYVRIKGKLDLKELSLIVSKIKQDSDKLNHAQVVFFLPGKPYNELPYAYCNNIDGDLWHSLLNKVSTQPPYDLQISE